MIVGYTGRYTMPLEREKHHINHADREIFDSAPGHHASPVGLRVAQPRCSPTGEACPAKPLGEAGRLSPLCSRLEPSSLIPIKPVKQPAAHRSLAHSHAAAFSRPRRPELCCRWRPRQMRGRGEGRVLVAPAVRVQQESTRQNHRYGRTSGLPRAMALRLIRDLPGDRLCCPRRPLRSS